MRQSLISRFPPCQNISSVISLLFLGWQCHIFLFFRVHLSRSAELQISVVTKRYILPDSLFLQSVHCYAACLQAYIYSSAFVFFKGLGPRCFRQLVGRWWLDTCRRKYMAL